MDLVRRSWWARISCSSHWKCPPFAKSAKDGHHHSNAIQSLQQRLRVSLPRCSWRVVGSEKAIDLKSGDCPVVEET